MKAYKGFNVNMTRRGFQYRKGESYRSDDSKAFEGGFHAYKHPLDAIIFSAPNDFVYHEVEVGGRIEEGEHHEIHATEIKIGERLSITDLVKAAIDFTMSHIKTKAKSNKDFGAASATGNKGAASTTGKRGVASATGDFGAAYATCDSGVASATGDSSVAFSTGALGAAFVAGDSCAAYATGRRGVASATGNFGVASATGDEGAASATSYGGVSSATGFCGVAASTGYTGFASAAGDIGVASATGVYGTASAENETAVAVSWGNSGWAKGVKGSHIVLADWRFDRKSKRHKLHGAKCVRIDGIKYKEDTWYTIHNGKIVEACNECNECN